MSGFINVEHVNITRVTRSAVTNADPSPTMSAGSRVCTECKIMKGIHVMQKPRIMIIATFAALTSFLTCVVNAVIEFERLVDPMWMPDGSELYTRRASFHIFT